MLTIKVNHLLGSRPYQLVDDRGSVRARTDEAFDLLHSAYATAYDPETAESGTSLGAAVTDAFNKALDGKANAFRETGWMIEDFMHR